MINLTFDEDLVEQKIIFISIGLNIIFDTKYLFALVAIFLLLFFLLML